MEVHHHSHTPTSREKRWTHYFWEFLMLFLAVFCGFLAEYQLEHKIERDREKQFIRSMIEDVSEDTTELSALVIDLRKNVSRMDSLKFLLCGANVRDQGSQLYYLGRRASRGSWLALHDRTIQQMKHSGGFRLIRNEKVSKAILEYYNRFNFIETLQRIDLSETEEYRKIAIGVFDPLIFDGQVSSSNQIIPPAGNPLLLTYDRPTLLRLAGMVSYSKNSRLALANAEDSMKTAAVNLIALLKKEYHLSEKTRLPK